MSVSDDGEEKYVGLSSRSSMSSVNLDVDVTRVDVEGGIVAN